MINKVINDTVIMLVVEHSVPVLVFFLLKLQNDKIKLLNVLFVLAAVKNCLTLLFCLNI
jgi:hypothetical protein